MPTLYITANNFKKGFSGRCLITKARYLRHCRPCKKGENCKRHDPWTRNSGCSLGGDQNRRIWPPLRTIRGGYRYGRAEFGNGWRSAYSFFGGPARDLPEYSGVMKIYGKISLNLDSVMKITLKVLETKKELERYWEDKKESERWWKTKKGVKLMKSLKRTIKLIKSWKRTGKAIKS